MPYFDHNSTTPVAPEVAAVMDSAQRQTFGNPSSTHFAGQAARQQLEKSRRTVAECLGAAPTEIVFTSGGTEANNLALFGLRRGLGTPAHLITTAIEHPAVLEPCRELEKQGHALTFAAPSVDGVVSASEIERYIRPDTALISVMHANNEVGVIQPIEEIASLVRARRAAGQNIYLHSDGVQAMGKIPFNLSRLGVDLYSVSGHKIYGPKGFGVLYVREGTPLKSMLFGGRHERDRRPGTENVPGAMAFARALELCVCQSTEYVAMAALRDAFEAELLAQLPGVVINGARAPRLPNTSNVLFPALSAETLVIALDMQGMAVSTGAACSSGSVEPSHVLLAMGLSREQARSSVRFSFGRQNSTAEIAALLACLLKSANKLCPALFLENQLA